MLQVAMRREPLLKGSELSAYRAIYGAVISSRALAAAPVANLRTPIGFSLVYLRMVSTTTLAVLSA
jgi:hypothetical protein